MDKSFKILIISVLISVFHFSFSQTKILDSLENKLQSTKIDSVRIRIMLDICVNTADYDYAYSLSKKSLTIVDSLLIKNPNDIILKRLKSGAFLVIGNSLYHKKNFIDAIQYFEKCTKNEVNENNSDYIVKAYITKGHCYYYLHDWEKSENFYKKAANIAFKFNDFKQYGDANRNIGGLFTDKGVLDSSLIFLNKAKESFEKVKDESGLADTYLEIGRVYYSNAYFAEAITYYQKALSIFEKLNKKRDLASVLNNIGIVFYVQNNVNQAIDYYEKSLEIKKEIGDELGASNSLMNIALIKLKLDDINGALKYFEESIELKQKIGDKSGQADCFSNIATIYNRSKKYDNAIDYLEKALEISDNLGLDLKKCGIYLKITETKMLQEKYLEAIKCSGKAIELSKKIKARNFLFTAYQNLSVAYFQIKDFENAYSYLVEANLLKDSIFNEKSSEQINEMQAKYESEKKQKEIELQKSEIGRQQAEIKQQTIQKYAFIVVIFLLILISVYIFISYRQKKKANVLLAFQNVEIKQQKEEITSQRDEIEAQRDKIVLQNSEITSSIKYAEKIQSVILPDLKIFSENFSDFFVLYRPKDIVSGDFYWTYKDNSSIFVAVADCTGHGVPGAIMSMLGITLLNEIVRIKRLSQPGLILNELRTSIIEALKQNNLNINNINNLDSDNESISNMKDGMDISLIAIKSQAQSLKPEAQSTVTSITYEAQWAGANNPLWIVKSPKPKIQSPKTQGPETLPSSLDLGLEACFLELKPNKMPIAIYERMHDFTNHELQLNSGDILYFMTDGYQDQFGGNLNKKFKTKNIKEIITKNQGLKMFEQKKNLEMILDQWIQNNEQTDDITILGIKV